MSIQEVPATAPDRVSSMRRVLNDAIADAAEGLDAGEGLPFEFFCECDDLSCKRLVELTVAGYRGRSRSGPVFADEPTAA